MSKPILLSSKDLWEKHVELVICILRKALVKLSEDSGIPEEEEEINRRLIPIAREIYHKASDHERPIMFNLFPTAEHSPPRVQDANKQWIRKRPDFKWRMQNNGARSHRELVKDFDIECKRLNANGKWVSEYIGNGIVRFLCANYRYGDGVTCGAMIGYIQDRRTDEIIEKVNARIKKQKRYALPQANFQRHQSVSQSVQRMSRKYVSPSSFCLYHLWIDVIGS